MAATLLTTDRRSRADLRRMKTLATGLLLIAAAVYVVASRAEHGGAGGWVGYVKAAAEAGMVGALADWFAVTALFRHPLGLPIPHTAIIPTRKDALGEGLSSFVGTHFLSEEVVRSRLRGVGVAGRVGEWLADRKHAERVTAEAAALARGAIGVLRDEDVRAILEQSVVPRLLSTQVGPPLGRLLGRVVEDGAHAGAVQLMVEKIDDWLVKNEALVLTVVAQQAPTWSPRFVDEKVAQWIYHELRRVAGEVRADPRHPARRSLDRFLAELAHDLQEDPDTIGRVEELKARLLSQPDVRGALGGLSATVRAMITEAVENPRSELRLRATAALVTFGRRLHTDPALRAKVDGWVEDAAAHLVTTYRDELTTTITETVNRWDGEETARKVELAVGRDLQFIRINGTVVGALAGVAIHAASQLL